MTAVIIAGGMAQVSQGSSLRLDGCEFDQTSSEGQVGWLL